MRIVSGSIGSGLEGLTSMSLCKACAYAIQPYWVGFYMPVQTCADLLGRERGVSRSAGMLVWDKDYGTCLIQFGLYLLTIILSLSWVEMCKKPTGLKEPVY